LIRVLGSTFEPEGQHSVTWNACDERGATVSSGVYFVRVALADGTMALRKVALVK